MRYLGGKMRQSRQIVTAVATLHPNFKTYVEPFCGALWSACAVMRAFPERRYVLNDVNPYLICTWRCGIEGWNPPKNPTEKDYQWYKQRRPLGDPMTGYLGFAWAFAGQFFGTPARTNGKFHGSYKSTQAKIDLLRQRNVIITCKTFENVRPPARSMIYLDPPYANRNPQSKQNDPIDRRRYYAYAAELSKNSTVIASEFLNPQRWPVLHDYGDTVIRHYAGKGSDGTTELLMEVT